MLFKLPTILAMAKIKGGRHGRDRMVVGFTYAYHH